MYGSGSLKGVKGATVASRSRSSLRNRVARYIDIHTYPKGKLEVGGASIRTISVFSGLRSEEDWSYNCASPTHWGSERASALGGCLPKPSDIYVRFLPGPPTVPGQVAGQDPSSDR